MTKHDYQTIRAALSFHRSYAMTALVMLLDAGLFFLALKLIDAGGLGYAIAQILLVLIFFHNFALLHECGHENSSRFTWLNTLTGHYASLFCAMPYFPWKYIHTEHHTWAGNLHRDPTLKAVRDYRETDRLKNATVGLAWRTWVPLLAFFQHLVFWSYPLMLLKMGRLPGRRLLACVVSVLLLPTVYVSLYLSLPHLFNLVNFGPAVLIYLVLVELVNLPHHMGTEIYGATATAGKLPVWQQTHVTRSCYYPKVMSELLLLNFNFHIEHHLFPNLPWHQLRRARHLVRSSLGDGYQECVGISWNLENRRKDVREVLLKDARGNGQHDELTAAEGTAPAS